MPLISQASSWDFLDSSTLTHSLEGLEKGRNEAPRGNVNRLEGEAAKLTRRWLCQAGDGWKDGRMEGWRGESQRKEGCMCLSLALCEHLAPVEQEKKKRASSHHDEHPHY